jgi:hypothetical protein
MKQIGLQSGMTPWNGCNLIYGNAWRVDQKPNNGRPEAVNTFYVDTRILSNKGFFNFVIPQPQ